MSWRGCLVCLSFGAVLVLSACSNPETEKVRHVERGDQYAADKRDTFAVVEYASAVKIDPKFGQARLKLAQTYERMNNLRAAYPEYIRAADALPEDRDIQIKATQILLLAGQFEDAKSRVGALLAKNPKDVDALLLHANAIAALRDPAGAIAQIEEALELNPGDSRVLVNLGAVKMQSGAAKEAEAAFRQAIELDPASADARLALANFLWASNRADEAEQSIREVLSRDPKHLLANRMLAVLYLATRRINDAEQPMKVLADTSGAPAARLQLADYYATLGRNDEAVAMLGPLSKDQETFVDAEARLAALDYRGGKTADAYKRLDALLARVPQNAPVLVMKARWLTAENKLDDALETAKKAVAADPQSAAAHFAAGVIYSQRRQTADATAAYTEALRLNPRALAAQVELSRLSLTSGDGSAALRYAEEARQSDPSSIDARVALVRSLIAANNTARAETEVADLLKQAPNVAVVQAASGTLLASKGDIPAAKAAYERALALSPGFLEALGGLTYLDMRSKASASAVARLDAEIARQPNRAPLYALLAQAHSASGNMAAAEQALKRAVSVDSRFTPGYTMLAQMYVQQRRIDAALVEYEGIAQRDPSATGARTMIGLLLEAQGKRADAQKAYEAIVNGGAVAPVAANNLAFIYAEQGTNLDVALQLATSAKQGLPDDPSVDDTIGWIYYKKGLASLAVRPLEESIRRRPDRPAVLYHLGLTYAQLGEKAKAHAVLTKAVALDPSTGGDEARRVLAQVSQ